MIEPDDFRMIELLTRADLAAHPAWADFHEARDRERILSWGVSVERLEAEIARYDYCGRAPLYPVLDLEALPEVALPSIGLCVRLADGTTLPGYLVGDSAFGIYLDDDEYCLNPSLPGRARAELERLAAALGRRPSELASLQYESVAELGECGRVSGTLDLA